VANVDYDSCEVAVSAIAQVSGSRRSLFIASGYHERKFVILITSDVSMLWQAQIRIDTEYNHESITGTF
jgi:hypothetical protein